MDQIKFWKSAYEEMRQIGLECGNVNIDLRENLESANKAIVALADNLADAVSRQVRDDSGYPDYFVEPWEEALTAHAPAIEKARGG